jgi:hypothetical protein
MYRRAIVRGRRVGDNRDVRTWHDWHRRISGASQIAWIAQVSVRLRDSRFSIGGRGRAEIEVRRTQGVLSPEQARTLLLSFQSDDEVWRAAAAWEESTEKFVVDPAIDGPQMAQVPDVPEGAAEQALARIAAETPNGQSRRLPLHRHL